MLCFASLFVSACVRSTSITSYRLLRTYYEHRRCSILFQVINAQHNGSVNAAEPGDLNTAELEILVPPTRASANCNRCLCQNDVQPLSVLYAAFVVALCVLANPLYDSPGSL